jgi:TonB family protein
VRLPSFCSFLVVLSPISMAGTSAADPRQSQAAFETAIKDHSTSPYIVLITVVDDRTGQTSTGCSTANLLRGAIYIEQWGRIDGTVTPEDRRARFAEVGSIALENTDHVFHFSNERALANILPFRYPEACAEIAKGRRARIGDRSGQVLLGPFVEGPMVVWSSCPSASYPLDAKPSNQGVTGVSVLVGPDGSMREINVAESSGFSALDEAIRSALSGCKFRSRTIDGEPVPEATWMHFRLRNQAKWPFLKPAESAGGAPR